jgi:hypothetical protein
MAINWADQEVKDRLLAAIIASFDGAVSLTTPHTLLSFVIIPSTIPLTPDLHTPQIPSLIQRSYQINCREVARLYGGDATYNAIENFLRKPKAKAKELKAEAAGRDGPAASPARPRAPKTPTKKDTAKATTPKSNGMYPPSRG